MNDFELNSLDLRILNCAVDSGLNLNLNLNLNLKDFKKFFAVLSKGMYPYTQLSRPGPNFWEAFGFSEFEYNHGCLFL